MDGQYIIRKSVLYNKTERNIKWHWFWLCMNYINDNTLVYKKTTTVKCVLPVIEKKIYSVRGFGLLFLYSLYTLHFKRGVHYKHTTNIYLIYICWYFYSIKSTIKYWKHDIFHFISFDAPSTRVLSLYPLQFIIWNVLLWI